MLASVIFFEKVKPPEKVQSFFDIWTRFTEIKCMKKFYDFHVGYVGI